MQKFNELIKEELKGWKPFDIIWLVTVSIVITVMSILFKYDKANDQFYWIHIVAATCGIINVVLGGKGKLSNYLFGFIHCCLMIYITLISKLYADFGVTVYNFIMQFVGFFTWSKNMNYETHEVMKIHMSNKARLVNLGIIIVGTIGFGLLMKYFISSPKPTVPTMITARLMRRALLLMWIFITSWVSLFMFFDQVKNPTNCMTKL